MKILVTGSLPEGFSVDVYERICWAIADQLAVDGHSVILGSDRADTADRLIFERIVEKGYRTEIVFYYHDEKDPPFDGKLQGARVAYERVAGGWYAGRIPQVNAADAIITIGGKDKTLLSALVGGYLRKAVLPVLASGGASASLWPQTRTELLHDRKTSQLLAAVETWNERETPRAIIKLAARMRELLARGSSSGVAMMYGLAISAVSLWLYTFLVHIGPPQLSLYLLCFSACTLGTLAPILASSLTDDGQILVSRGSLAIKPLGAIPMAFVLYLTYLFSGYVVNGDLQFFSQLSKNDSFLRVALVISVIGLSAGAVIDRGLRVLSERGITLGG